MLVKYLIDHPESLRRCGLVCLKVSCEGNQSFPQCPAATACPGFGIEWQCDPKRVSEPAG
jgi:hypothetical protein